MTIAVTKTYLLIVNINWFRKSRSIITNLLDLIDDIVKSLDEGNNIDLNCRLLESFWQNIAL